MRGAIATRGGARGEAARPELVAGRYRPLRPLGSGGSASVWLARDEESSHEVALKVVRREGKAAFRAEREVEAATRLRHPRCLRALALERDDEHVYVAYEYVRGRTLRDVMRAGDLDDRAAVEAAAQVLEGLAHAHGKGVVHRDVKPANVMLEDADAVSVRVLDFGLAQVEEADTLTAAGDVPGTLAYISPERLDGHGASGAADVWSVGVFLWEALAGWHPFSSASPVETARRIREGPRPLAAARPDLPGDLCALVDRMLVRDPRRRPPAKRLGDMLRDAYAAQARRPRPAVSLGALRERALHAGLAVVLATGSTLLLPFFPRGVPFLLGLLAGVVALRAPRAGLALALAAPVLPLGNVALGLAVVYAVAAALWLALFARDPASGLLFVAGPLLAPVGGLALAPVVALRARGPVRRAAIGAGAVLAAAATAAATGRAFPLGGVSGASLDPDVLGGTGATLGQLRALLAEHPAVAAEACLFAAAAVAIPLARRHGLWGLAGWGGAFLATALLLPPLAELGAVSAAGLALGVWAATVALAVETLRRPA
jgi:Protein kinase domain